MIPSEELLSIGEMSERTGVSVSALRFYEDEGLIASVRSAGNQRRYPRHMLRRVSIIVAAKRLGIPLNDVRSVFDKLPLDRTPTQADWERASTRWKRQLQERRDRLEQLVNELAGCIGCGCLSLRACALLNPEDSLGSDGSGPRRLD